VGDRVAGLIRRAAATRAIDFSQADPFDPSWTRRLWLVLLEIDAAGSREILALRAARQFALLSRTDLTTAGYDSLVRSSAQLIDAFAESLSPSGAPADPNHERNALSQSWIAAFGDPRDPAVAASIAATAASLRAHDVSSRGM
jgi:hypothetical protein